MSGPSPKTVIVASMRLGKTSAVLFGDGVGLVHPESATMVGRGCPVVLSRREGNRRAQAKE